MPNLDGVVAELSRAEGLREPTQLSGDRIGPAVRNQGILVLPAARRSHLHARASGNPVDVAGRMRPLTDCKDCDPYLWASVNGSADLVPIGQTIEIGGGACLTMGVSTPAPANLSLQLLPVDE